jgi:hypothetical protein
MKRIIYLSTVIRGAPISEGGHLYKIDWDQKQILKKQAIAPPAPEINDPNPRGNTRGGRGILVDQDRIKVATYHSLLEYDHELKALDVKSGNLLVGLHEISAQDTSILAAATAIDGVVEIKADGSEGAFWHVSESETLRRELGLAPQAYDPQTDHRLRFLDAQHLKSSNHTHLNAVTVFNGERWVLLNQFGIVFNIDRDQIIVRNPDIRGCHNLIVTSDLIYVNDTLGKRVMIYDHEGHLQKQIDLLKVREIQKLYRKVRSQRLLMLYNYLFQKQRLARPLFVRGLALGEDNQLFVSFSPATIAQFDMNSNKLVDMLNISRDLVCAPHGLALGTHRKNG